MILLHQQKIQFQLGKLLCPTCDKLKFRCICPKTMLNTLTPIKTMLQSSSSSTQPQPLQTNSPHTSKSIDAIDAIDGNENVNDLSGCERTSRLLTFQWPNLFNNRNSKSTSQLNLVNCDSSSTMASGCSMLHDRMPKGSKVLFIFFIILF